MQEIGSIKYFSETNYLKVSSDIFFPRAPNASFLVSSRARPPPRSVPSDGGPGTLARAGLPGPWLPPPPALRPGPPRSVASRVPRTRAGPPRVTRSPASPEMMIRVTPNCESGGNVKKVTTGPDLLERYRKALGTQRKSLFVGLGSVDPVLELWLPTH